MHGHHGWGHHWGGGWGFGWLFPALILGRLISDSVPRQPAWPYPPQPNPAPQPPSYPTPVSSPEAKAALHCPSCNQAVSSDFAFCPHCGKRIAPPTCRYCGQTLNRGVAYCTYCGGPAR